MLADTIEELRSVALAADDASGHFPAMYARVTRRIERDATTGMFVDGDGMMRFARAFARWYLRPRSGVEPIAGSWRAAWDVAGDRRLLIVQHLLLGINAHVNHDLPQVVVELADDRGDLARMRADFDAVNAVLAATMPDVIRDLGTASRWVNVVAARGGGRLFHFSLERARAQAWLAAERLYPLDPAARDRQAAEIDRLVGVLAYLVAHPGRPIRWFTSVGRLLESDDPRAVTRTLLGDLS
jgi:hypothetical protein